MGNYGQVRLCFIYFQEIHMFDFVWIAGIILQQKFKNPRISSEKGMMLTKACELRMGLGIISSQDCNLSFGDIVLLMLSKYWRCLI